METNDSHIESGVGPATVWDITEAWSGWVVARHLMADLSGRYSCLQHVHMQQTHTEVNLSWRC